MKLFAELLEDISFARNENVKIHLLIKYFEQEGNHANKDEVLNLLVGYYPKKGVSSKQLKIWSTELTGYPEWIIDRSEQEIGNFIKTFALLLGTAEQKVPERSFTNWISAISRFSISPESEIKNFIKNELALAEPRQRLLVLRLLTGTFKSPIPEITLVKCLSKILHIAPALISLRLDRGKMKRNVTISELGNPTESESNNIPWQFPEIKFIDNSPVYQGKCEDWEAFGYRNGIEVQLVKHEKTIYLWTSELEIITDKFPEIINSCMQIHEDFALYGQILPGSDGTSLEALKNRINKKNITKNDLQSCMAVFCVWKILKFEADTTIKFRDIYKDVLVS